MKTIPLIAIFICALVGCTAKPSSSKVGIQVIAGTYGENCRAAHGNVTPRLAAACDGKASCTYKVDVNVLGDPAPNCAKDYIAEWTCGESSTVNKVKAELKPEHHGDAGLGSIVTLTCDGGR
jgi:hypothetical protein